MNPSFFEKPILNSPYELPRQHWELDDSGQPTQKIIQTRRQAKFISPIPKPRNPRPGRSGARVPFWQHGHTSVGYWYSVTTGRMIGGKSSI